MMGLREGFSIRCGVPAGRLPCRYSPAKPRRLSRKSTGRWLLTTICPVRLGRCNSLLRGGDSHGRAQAHATVILCLISKECGAATRGNPCALRDALYTRTQRKPNAETSFSEDCPKRNDRPTGVTSQGNRLRLRFPLLTLSL